MDNVTVDPSASAAPVDNPARAEVRSLRTGHLLEAKCLIRLLSYDAAICLRGVLKEATIDLPKMLRATTTRQYPVEVLIYE